MGEMTRGQIFETSDLDLATFLVASTERFPSVVRVAGSSRAAFHFSRDAGIEAQVVLYSSGATMANVRRLLAARRRLFHEVRRVQREGL